MQLIIRNLINAKITTGTFRLLGRFAGETAVAVFRCQCGHDIELTLLDIHTGIPCPKCKGTGKAVKHHAKRPISEETEPPENPPKPATPRLTIERVQTRAAEKGIELAGEYVGMATRTRWRCLASGHVFTRLPASVFNGNGCPSCKKESAPDIAKKSEKARC